MSECRRCSCRRNKCQEYYPMYYPCYPMWPFPPCAQGTPCTPDTPGTGMVGAYSDFRCVTHQDVAIFNEALGTILGVSYTPLLVSTQVVNGTNYIFIAQASTITCNNLTKELVRVQIYADLQGNVSVVSIEDCLK